MKLIKQTNDYNCGSACLAMLLGLDSCSEAEEVMGRSPGDRHDDLNLDPPYVGLDIYEATAVLFRCGIKHGVFLGSATFKENDTWYSRGYDKWSFIKDAEAFEHLRRGGTALLGVPSLNNHNSQHWIVYSEGKVFDPSLGDCYHEDRKITIILGLLIGDYRGKH